MRVLFYICVFSIVFQLHWCVQTLIAISLSSVIHWDSSCRWDSPFDLGILCPYCPSLPVRSSSSPNESSDLSFNRLTKALHQSISRSQVSPSCDLSSQAFFYNRLQSVSIRIQFLQPRPPPSVSTLLRHTWWIILPDEEISRYWWLNLISFTLAQTKENMWREVNQT